MHDLGVPWIEGGPRDIGNHALAWGQGRRMSELCGAAAATQLSKLPQIVSHMRASNARIRQMLEGTPGLQFRRLNDPDGDTGPFVILVLDDADAARRTVAGMRERGVTGGCRLADYGLHIYYHCRALVEKAPLSAAGNPWSLPQNRESQYDYAKGACPRSDALFERSIIVPVPSRLTAEQEEIATRVIREAVA